MGILVTLGLSTENAPRAGKNIIADFEGKVGKREIAQGVLGSKSLIITLDDLKKIIIDIKILK